MGKPLTGRQIVFALLALSAVSGYLYLKSEEKAPGLATSAIVSPLQSTVTLAKFERIRVGMTLDEVRSLIGSRGVLQSQTQAGDITIEMHAWQNPGGSNAVVTLENGKVSGKAQALMH